MTDHAASRIDDERERVADASTAAAEPRRPAPAAAPSATRSPRRRMRVAASAYGRCWLRCARLSETLTPCPPLRRRSALSRRDVIGVALVSATLLMTELALTRIFSVVMYYHFAFLAISIALFGLSASGVFAYVARRWLDRYPTRVLLARQAAIYAACTVVALFVLVRLRVGLNYTPRNLAADARHLRAGGAALLHRRPRHHARDLALLVADQCRLRRRSDRRGRRLPRADPAARPARRAGRRPDRGRAGADRRRALRAGRQPRAVSPASARRHGRRCWPDSCPASPSSTSPTPRATPSDRVLFSKWNSFSRIGVYERTHGDWSLSYKYNGPLPDTRYMDIDSAASTPILHLEPDLANVQYLRYELTALAYHLKERRLRAGDRASAIPSPARAPGSARPGFSALVIGPGGGRDLVSALVFGAERVDGVEINPIIADDVMRDRFREYSGGIYTNPARPHHHRRRAELRAPDAGPLRRHPGIAGRHLGGDGRRRLHADREHAVYGRGVQRLPRPPHRRRRAHDHAVGARRPAPDLAGAGGVRIARLGRRVAPGHRPARSGRDVPAEEDAVHRRRSGAAAERIRAARISTCCTRPASTDPPRSSRPTIRSTGRTPGDYAQADSARRTASGSSPSSPTTSVRRPTIGRSISTRRS